MKHASLESPWAGRVCGVFGTDYAMFLCICLLIDLLSVRGREDWFFPSTVWSPGI